jgi:hydrogenase maturation factor
MATPLPLGKLPLPLLRNLINRNPLQDPDVLLGPGIGMDCAVIDVGGRLLVLKSDPITFATDHIGWYVVQVNANDLATTGAIPRWFLATILLPENLTTEALVLEIDAEIHQACRKIGVEVIGGHTEITYNLDRPIVTGTLIGEIAPGRLITPQGASPGDRLLLTKSVPIEATAILAREFPDRLERVLPISQLQQASQYLHDPGISVLRDAQIATGAGNVTAMHDPTEGGLAAALWELAEASGHSISFDPVRVPITPLSRNICQIFDLDPLAAIASGALLLTVSLEDAEAISTALKSADIQCTEIGAVEVGPPDVWVQTAGGRTLLIRPERDALAALFEKK